MAQGKAYDKEKVAEALRPYLQLGCSLTKACNYAGIPHQTVSKWTKDDPNLLLKITSWQNMVNAQARKNMAEKVIEGDHEASKWWLERREKDDFSTRSEVTGAEGEPLIKIDAGPDPYKTKEGAKLIALPEPKLVKGDDDS